MPQLDLYCSSDATEGMGEPHRCHCVVSLRKTINPSLVLIQPRRTRSYITERLLMGRKESNQTNKEGMVKVFKIISEFRNLRLKVSLKVLNSADYNSFC